MEAKQKAIILHDKMFVNSKSIGGAFTDWELAKQCALIVVDEIINANPYSNPLNTNVESTMQYWQEVKKEIEKL